MKASKTRYYWMRIQTLSVSGGSGTRPLKKDLQYWAAAQTSENDGMFSGPLDATVLMGAGYHFHGDAEPDLGLASCSCAAIFYGREDQPQANKGAAL